MSTELEDIREKKNSTGLYIVIGLLLVGMAGFGTSQFGIGANQQNPAALKLNDSEIDMFQFQNALTNLRAQNADMSEADIQSLAMSQLTQDLALTNYIKENPLASSNKTIDENIRNNPSFFEGGAFSEDVFRRIIRVEPKVYRQDVSERLAKQTLQQTLIETSIVSDADTAPYQAMQNLTRDILVAKIAKDSITNTANEEEIQAYFDENKASYQTEEQVNIEYVDFNPDNIISAIEVSEAEILSAAQPTRTANYYLFTDAASAQSAIDSVNAGKTIDAMKTDFVDTIEDSGELDNLSAVAGDDALIPQNAVDAIFSLTQTGQLTAPIEVDGSLYVFELASEPKTTFSDAEKAAAKSQRQKEKAAPLLAELNEKLNQAVFEAQSPSLSDIAAATDLSVQSTGLVDIFSRKDVLVENTVVQAIQNGDKAIGKLQEPVTIGDRVIIYRLTERKAPEQQPLVAVKTEVERAVIAEKTQQQLDEAADALIEATKTAGLAAAAANKNYPTQAVKDFEGRVPTDSESDILDPMGAILIAQQSPMLGNAHAQKVTSITGDVLVYVNTDIRLGENGTTDNAANNAADNAADTDALTASLAAGLGRLQLEAFLKSLASNAEVKVRTGLFDNQSANPASNQ